MSEHRPELYAVFGRPILHSLSPKIHQAGFREMGWHHRYYVPVDVGPGQLEQAVHAFERLGGLGINLTRPLKEEALRASWIGGRDDWAQEAGAVNTLTWRAGQWFGANTDAPALSDRLQSGSHRGRRALVLGAGGAARATVVALLHAGLHVTVASRRAKPAWTISAGVMAPEPGWVSWTHGMASLGDFDVVVNATPLGQAGEPSWDSVLAFRPRQTVVDWVYAPRQTAFLATARAAGAETLDGLELLVRQAGLAWHHWFSVRPPWQALGDAVGVSLPPDLP